MCYGTGVLTYIHMEAHKKTQLILKNKSNAPNFIFASFDIPRSLSESFCITPLYKQLH